MIFEEDLCSLHQVSLQDLHKEASWQVLCTRALYKSSLCTDLFKTSLGKTSWTRPLQEISWLGLFMRSLYKLSIKALLARFMQETSWQDLSNRSLCNVSVQDHQKRIKEVSWQYLCARLCARSLCKISVMGLLARLLKGSLHKLSI